MKTLRVRISALLLGPALALLPATGQAAFTFDVSLNTAPLGSASGGPFRVAFDLTNGGPPSNTVTINNFRFAGGSPTGLASTVGGASGSLAGTVTLTDTAFFNSFEQAFTA